MVIQGKETQPTRIYHQMVIRGKETQPTRICTQQEDLEKNDENVK